MQQPTDIERKHARFHKRILLGMGTGLVLSGGYLFYQLSDSKSEYENYFKEHSNITQLVANYESMKSTAFALKIERKHFNIRSLEQRFSYLPLHVKEQVVQAFPNDHSTESALASLDTAVALIEQDMHGIESHPEFSAYQQFDQKQQIGVSNSIVYWLLSSVLVLGGSTILCTLNDENKRKALVKSCLP